MTATVRPGLLLWGALLVGCAARVSAPPVTPEAASPPAAVPRLVSTGELARWQREGPVLLLDVRTDVFAYLKGHLPGAEYLHGETVRASEGGIPTRLLAAGAYRELFSRLGIVFERPVVVYSAGETRDIDATFVTWLLAGFGHPRVYLLDGGFFKWQLEQRPIVQRYPRIPRSEFGQRPFGPEQASLEDVRRARTGGALLVDARPPDQYAGTAGAQMRQGHIPGAINHYWQDDLTQEGFGHVWKSPDELRRNYRAQGVTPDRDIIAYCNSATEASHVHFALRYLLGYPRVRVYVGSWTEWSEIDSLPVATGSSP
ncbi:MAG TPA: sulfurtransferase [Gemmatimonadales bacterium]|nr:sulfurtransferase [Gemmatimonadales bacterium]